MIHVTLPHDINLRDTNLVDAHCPDLPIVPAGTVGILKAYRLPFSSIVEFPADVTINGKVYQKIICCADTLDLTYIKQETT